MRFYFAGAESFEELLREAGAKNFLVSYFNYRNKGIERLTGNELVFLDSGAFTAWSKGTYIDIDKYAEYLKEHGDKFELYANLDVIGDSAGTHENQEYLESKGLSPLPTVHYDGDLELLKWYGENYDYIALGGLVPYAKEPQKLRNWLNKCFKILAPMVKEKGLKIHGFGIGTASVLKRYPFYSADSSGWISGGKFGTVVNWDDQQYKLLGGSHFQDKETYLERGNDLKLMDHYNERLTHNIKEYMKMEAGMTKLWEERGISWG